MSLVLMVLMVLMEREVQEEADEVVVVLDEHSLCCIDEYLLGQQLLLFLAEREVLVEQVEAHRLHEVVHEVEHYSTLALIDRVLHHQVHEVQEEQEEQEHL